MREGLLQPFDTNIMLAVADPSPT